MFALTSVRTSLLLALAVALGPLATDMYLPALPQIGQDLNSPAGPVQLTLSLYLAGFALAQLIYGPLSDRYGRKPVMIAGLLIFILASIGCACAESIETLMACRFLQAIGGCAGPVLGRAAIRDIYPPRQAARMLALLASLIALAPALAPTLGGLLLARHGWGAIFVVLAVYGVVTLALLAFAMPESLPPERRQSVPPAQLLRNYRILMADIRFLGYTGTNAAIYGGLFAFLSGAPFVLIEVLGIAPHHFGPYTACMVVGYMAGNLISARLSGRAPGDRILARGLLVAMAGGGSMAILAWQEVASVWAVILPQTLFMLGAGMLLPQALAGALANFPGMAGSASALFGFVQMAVAAGAGALVGHLHDGTPRVMAMLIAGCALTALACYLLLVHNSGRNLQPQGAAGL